MSCNANPGCALALAREVERGARLPEIILVGTDESSVLTVLEGHVRLTALIRATVPGDRARNGGAE